jgi:adenylate cyclase
VNKRKAARSTLLPAAVVCLGFSLLWSAWFWIEEHLVSENFVPPLMIAELLTQDFRLRHGTPAPVDPRIVFLGFDLQAEDRPFDEEFDASRALQLMRVNWPWSREVWAEAIDRLAAAGARAIIIDLLFTNPGTGDDKLAAALARHADKVVLGYNFGNTNAGTNTALRSIYPSDTIIGGVMESLPILAYVNFYPDADDTIRRATYQIYEPTLGGEGTVMHSLSAKALLKAGWTEHLPRDSLQHRFRYAGPPNVGFPYRPIYEIFTPGVWESNYGSGAFFQDKIVIIGPAANWTQDLQKTPYLMPMFGPEVHANALNAALTGAFIREPDPRFSVLIIAGAGLAAFALMAATPLPAFRMGGLALGSILILTLAYLLYDRGSWMVALVAPLLNFNCCGAGVLFHQFLMDRIEKARTRATFEKYVSANVVKEILDRSEDFEETLGGRRMPCTMLFSDIRGFTTVTESADSQALVTQLNEYLTEMVEAVFRHGGTLDKFIGDAVMAVWGNTTSLGPADDARNAVRTALDMLTSLQALNTRWKSEGRMEFHIGIGLNHGEVIAGNMGSPRRKEFTVIGDAVNLASRLEGVTKEYGLSLVIGESVANLVRGHFPLQTVDLIQVKGKTKPVDTFTIPLTPPDPAALALYEEAIRDYRAGHFLVAKKKLDEVRSALPGNDLPSLYSNRCRHLIENPPQEWTGVWVMKTK